ncbi:MAG: hypothetical protein AB2L24_04730 [Mangrovibacterium sp.]
MIIENDAKTYPGTVRLSYTDPLKWFYKEPLYTSGKPEFLSSVRGFRLKDRMIYALLSTTDEFKMKTTDAEAILPGFFFLPGEKWLKRVLPEGRKLIILPVNPWLMLLSGLPGLVKKLEQTGAAGLYAGRWLPNTVLKKICSESPLPVICATGPRLEEITLKINAGAYAACLRSQDISRKLVSFLHEAYPYTPVIASCGRSKKGMLDCVKSRVDAVIFKPCILFEAEFFPGTKRFLRRQG